MIKNYRDHAANERTYLAWVRTGVTVMVLGFFIEKFDIFLATTMGSADADRLTSGFDIHYLAVFLVALGLFSIIFSTVHYMRTNRKIDREEELPFRDLAMPLMMSALLLVFGAVLLLTLVRVI